MYLNPQPLAAISESDTKRNQHKTGNESILPILSLNCRRVMPSNRSSFLLLILVALFSCYVSTAFPLYASSTNQQQYRKRYSPAVRMSTDTPFAVIVEAEIDPNRMAEFLQLIQTNAVESRKEPGCLRFDVLRSQESPNRFFFYELYQNVQAVDHHKKQPHYNLWAEFKASGGTLSSVSHKTDAEFVS